MKLYLDAIGEAEPEAILTAARAWVAAADAPRFLPPLTKWLAARGWEKDPPKKPGRRRDSSRASVAVKPTSDA